MKAFKCLLLSLFSFSSIYLMGVLLFPQSALAACTDPCNLCGSCIPANTAAMSQLGTCQTEGIMVSQDATFGEMACATDNLVGSLIPPALTAPAPGMNPTSAYGLLTMKIDMLSMGQLLTQTLELRKNSVLSAYSDFTSSVSQNIPKMVEAMRMSDIQTTRSFQENEMEFMIELKEAELRAAAQDMTGTSEEEIKFILYELSKAQTPHTPVVIAGMKAKYDSRDDFYIPVRYKNTQSAVSASGCPEYDPELNGELSDYSCYKGVKSNPGKKLELYFRECSRNKTREMAELSKKGSAGAQAKMDRKPAKIENQTLSSASAVAKNSFEQGQSSCDAVSLRKGMCSLGEEYTSAQIKSMSENNPDELVRIVVERVANNEVVFNGNLSPMNMLEPEVIGTIDGTVRIDEDEYKAILAKAGEVSDVAVSTNTPQLISTYKTSAQYFAATDYASNIVNKGLIANISPTERNDKTKANYVAAFLQHQAILNLTQYSFSKSISERTGMSVSDKMFKEELERDSIVKEDINGAGYVDSLRHQVEGMVEKVGGVPYSELSGEQSPNPKHGSFEAELVKAKLNLDELLAWERIELLLATRLVQETNSKEMKDFISALRNQ